jgi:hypothetical protein
MHTVIELPEFLRRAKWCGVTDNERSEIVDFIAANPQCGEEMPGTGGARKVRFAKPGQGKRSSYRIITFYSGIDIPVFLLSMFAKNEKSDMTQGEKNELKKLLKILPESYMETKT